LADPLATNHAKYYTHILFKFRVLNTNSNKTHFLTLYPIECLVKDKVHNLDGECDNVLPDQKAVTNEHEAIQER
jgi:hypothetical protein